VVETANYKAFSGAEARGGFAANAMGRIVTHRMFDKPATREKFGSAAGVSRLVAPIQTARGEEFEFAPRPPCFCPARMTNPLPLARGKD